MSGRFKSVAIPYKFYNVAGHAITDDGARFFIPEDMREKLGWTPVAGVPDYPEGVIATVGRIPFTPAEEAERDVEESEFEVARPLNEWFGEMAKLDGKISRREEDLIDFMVANGADINKLPPVLLKAYQDKKTKRAQRPK